MPLILLISDRLIKDKSGDDGSKSSSSTLLCVAGLALAYGGFIWSHVSTVYQFSLVLGICLPLLALLRKNVKGLVYSGLGMTIGLGLSAAYLYPAWREKNLIHNEFIGKSWPYHDSYVFPMNDYAFSNWDFFTRIDDIWILNTCVILFGALAVLVLLGRHKTTLQIDWNVNRFWFVAGIIPTFLMMRVSYNLSLRIPMIDIGVFSWRMLGITSIVACLVIGASLQAARILRREQHLVKARLLAGFAIFLLLSGAGVSIYLVIFPMYDVQAFEASDSHLNWASLPSTVHSEPEDLPDYQEKVRLLEERGEVRIDRWATEHRVIHTVTTGPAKLWVRTFNFPGWEATMDGKHVEIESASEIGEMLIRLPAGEHNIVLDYSGTPVQKRGSLVTIISAAFVVCILISSLVLKRHHRAGIKQT